FQDRGPRAADGLEEGMLVGAERAPACRAVGAPLHVAERLEVAAPDLRGVGASRVVAPSPFESQGVSPPHKDDTLNARSRLTGTPWVLTAYGYSPRDSPPGRFYQGPVAHARPGRTRKGREGPVAMPRSPVGVRGRRPRRRSLPQIGVTSSVAGGL